MAKGIRQLESHTDTFVTVAELADYWLVSRKQIYKQIQAGTLPAVRIGPRLLRIRTVDAFRFENSADFGSAITEPEAPQLVEAPPARKPAAALPAKASRRVAAKSHGAKARSSSAQRRRA